jgi:hypothetical protein
MAERRRALVALAILAGVVALFAVVRPADLGPWISAVVVGGALAALPIALGKWSGARQVAVATTCGLAGAGVGFALGLDLDIGPSQHSLSRAVSAIGVPAGFEKVTDYGCDSGPFCPQTVYTRDYLGNGPVAAVADSILARMHKACFKDAAISPGDASFPGSLALSGTCVSRDARVGVSVYEERIGPGPPQVRIAFGAYGL